MARTPKTLKFADIPRDSVLPCHFGKAILGYNTEFEAFGHCCGQPPTWTEINTAKRVHGRCMRRYRNWALQRKGGRFCKTELCVMPNTVIAAEGTYVVLTIEFSANNNTFTGGPQWYTDTATGQRRAVQEHQGYSDPALRKRLGQFLLRPPASVLVARSVHSRSYHVLYLCARARAVDKLFDYVDQLDARFTTEFADLRASHEVIC